MAGVARKRFWIYTHDDDGDIVKEVGEEDTMSKALDDAGAELWQLHIANDLATITVRIVDLELAPGGVTVWWAGPRDWRRGE